jgi:hypothetical protein
MARRTVWSDLRDYLGDSDSRRGWALCAQDGIISTAGILLGFVGAGADEETLLVAGQAAIVAGMLTAGGAKWSETATRRAVELRRSRTSAPASGPMERARLRPNAPN